MDLLDVGDVTEDAVEVLLVLLNASRVSDARGVDDVDHLPSSNKDMRCGLLSCRLSLLKVFIVGRLSDVDVLTLPSFCGEGELGWDRCNHLCGSNLYTHSRKDGGVVA